MQTRKTKQLINLLPYIVCLFFLYIAFQMNALSDNFSGLLSRNQSPFIRIGFLFYGCWIGYLLWDARKQFTYYLYIFSTVITIFIPYRDGHLFGTIHLASAYTLFLSLQYLIINTYLYDKTFLQTYILLVALSLFLCVTTMTVNYLGQCIYAIGISFLLKREG